jgi:hypothetical protein
MFPALATRPNPKKSREFFGIRGFFSAARDFARQNHCFFAAGPRKRLRSVGETASYGSNSAVDSPGAAWRLQGGGRVSARRREAPRHSGA